MTTIRRTRLARDADSALDGLLLTRVAAAPGRIAGAPLPSDVGPDARAQFARRHSLRVRALVAWRIHRRHGAAWRKAEQN